MNSHPNMLAKEVLKIFPEQIKVFELLTFKKNVSKPSESFLHQHFSEPLSEHSFRKLAIEIAEFLNDKEPHFVYSFFFRSPESGWILSSACLNKTIEGLPKEIVFFSYELNQLGDIKNKLSRVLENDLIFKENYAKVSLLTKREKEILSLVAAGMSSQKIANKIYLSIHTVNTHRRSINEKLDIHNFAGLLRIAEIFDLTATESKNESASNK